MGRWGGVGGSVEGKPLSSVDAAWLHMERPENLMNVTAMLRFAGPLSREDVVAVVRERLLPLPRFRARLATAGRRAWPRWVPVVGEPELDYHVVEHGQAFEEGGEGLGDDAPLRVLISALMSRPLDRTRPLWQLHLIREPGGGTALLCRVHHALGDGIALMMVFLSLTELSPASARRADEPPNPLWRLFSPARGSAREAQAYVERLMPVGARLLLRARPAAASDAPRPRLRSVTARPTALGITQDLTRLALRWPDTPNRLHGPLRREKRAAWSRAIALDELQVLRSTMGGTVNDIVVAVTTGALRHYLLERGERIEGQEVRATLPVNLRGLEGLAELGNVFGLMFLDLPVGIADPRARLRALVRRTDALKRSPEAVVTYGILRLLGYLPAALERVAVAFFSARATAVMTNVPGPERPVFFGEHEVSDILFWVPQSGDIGLGISIGSYAGRLRVGFSADAGLVPDPEMIVAAFERELESLVAAARTGRAPG